MNDKNRLSLFKEFYYWIYFYLKKSRANPPAGIEWVSCLFLSLFRFLNILVIWVFIGLIFKLIGGFKNDYFKFYINESVAFIKFIAVLLCPLDLFLFYRKRKEESNKFNLRTIFS